MAGPGEIDYQHKIIKSVRLQGGYGKKWSSSYAVGVPDLILALPGIGGFLMEVKLFKDIAENGKFDRQIDVTALQAHELQQYHDAGGLSTIGIVVKFGPRDVRLVILKHTETRFTSEQLKDPLSHVKWDGHYFDVRTQMERFMRYGR